MQTGEEGKLERVIVALHDVRVSLESLRIVLEGLQSLSCDHEGRLRTIERWQNNLTPVLAAMTFVLGIAATQVLSRLL